MLELLHTLQPTVVMDPTICTVPVFTFTCNDVSLALDMAIVLQEKTRMIQYWFIDTPENVTRLFKIHRQLRHINIDDTHTHIRSRTHARIHARTHTYTRTRTHIGPTHEYAQAQTHKQTHAHISVRVRANGNLQAVRPYVLY